MLLARLRYLCVRTEIEDPRGGSWKDKSRPLAVQDINIGLQQQYCRVPEMSSKSVWRTEQREGIIDYDSSVVVLVKRSLAGVNKNSGIWLCPQRHNEGARSTVN